MEKLPIIFYAGDGYVRINGELILTTASNNYKVYVEGEIKDLTVLEGAVIKDDPYDFRVEAEEEDA